MEQLLARYMLIPAPLRWGAIAAALFAICLAGVLLVEFPAQDSLTTLLQQQQDLMRIRQAKQQEAATLAAAEAKAAELGIQLEQARLMLPEHQDVPQFLATLGNSAKEVGLLVNKFEPKGEVEQDFYAEIVFGMQARGAYHDLGAFIDQISRFDRIVNVSNLSLTAPRVESQRIVLDASFVVKTYRFLTAEQAEQVAARKAKGKK